MECSVCAGKYKNGRGLKIHQTKAGCGKQLPGSHRNTNKSEATSTPDSNHSDAHGRVRLETTHRGNGAQEMEAMVKVNKQIKRKKWTSHVRREGKLLQVEGE